jgi:hypothetical protein
MDTYTQCYLIKGERSQVAWIPSEFAIIEKIIKIKIDGEWDDGWKIIRTYNTRTSEHIKEHERDYLKQRSASDI